MGLELGGLTEHEHSLEFALRTFCLLQATQAVILRLMSGILRSPND